MIINIRILASYKVHLEYQLEMTSSLVDRSPPILILFVQGDYTGEEIARVMELVEVEEREGGEKGYEEGRMRRMDQELKQNFKLAF